MGGKLLCGPFLYKNILLRKISRRHDEFRWRKITVAIAIISYVLHYFDIW